MNRFSMDDPVLFTSLCYVITVLNLQLSCTPRAGPADPVNILVRNALNSYMGSSMVERSVRSACDRES
jgi:hypothetical protein